MLIGAAGRAELLPPPQGMAPQSCRVLGGHDLVQTLQMGVLGGWGSSLGAVGMGALGRVAWVSRAVGTLNWGCERRGSAAGVCRGHAEFYFKLNS